MFRLLRKALLLLFLAGITGVALYPKDLFLKVVAWRARTFCEKVWGSTLSYQSLRLEEGKIILTEGDIQDTNTFHLKVEEMVFSPRFDWRKRKWGGELTLENVQYIQKKPPHFSFSSTRTKRDLKLTIKGGEVLLYDFSGPSTQVHHFPFELTQGFEGNTLLGSLSLDLDKPLQIHYIRQPEGITLLDTEFAGQEIAPLAHIIRYFSSNALREPSLDWTFSEGTISGRVAFEWKEGKIQEWRGDLKLAHLKGENHSLGLCGECREVSTAVHLDAHNLDFCNGMFEVTAASFSIKEHHPELWGGMWDLCVHHAHLGLQKGHIEHSSIEASLLGMQGEMTLDWLAQDVLVCLNFSGSSKEMQPLLPDFLQKRFAAAFPDDTFGLNAFVKRKNRGLELEGELLIQDGEGEKYPFAFGCHFGESEELATPLDSFMENLKEQFYLSHHRLGWFRASQLPLEKFLSPFLLHDVRLEASGRGDFEGTFDDRFLIVFYRGENFQLESPHFSLKAPHIERNPLSDTVAVHYLNFETWEHRGFLPLAQATYCQKNQDLTFSRGSGLVYFENNTISVEEIDTCWENLRLHGEVKVKIHALDQVDLWIHTKEVTGPISDGQSFLAHFVPSLFWNVPIEGALTNCGGEGHFHYLFEPHAHLVEGSLSGNMKGTYRTDLFVLEDYSVDYLYDYAQESVTFSTGEGMLLFPKIPTSSFHVITPKVTFSDFSNLQLNLALELWNHDRKIVDLSGDTSGDATSRHFHLEGEGFTLHGTQEGRHISIENFACGDLSGSADWDWRGTLYHIKTLLIDAGEIGKMALAGDLDRKQSILSAEVTDLSLNLDQISSFSWLPTSLQEWLESWSPRGNIEGRGALQWDIKKNFFSAQVWTDIEEFAFGGISFGNEEELRCLFSSDHGVMIDGLGVEIPGETGPLYYNLGRFHYHLASQKIEFEGINFCLSTDRIPWVLEKANLLFPGKIPSSLSEWTQALKQNEPLEGSLSVEVFPQNLWVYLTLKDGTYHFCDRKFDVKNFSLVYDPLEFNILTDCRFLDSFYKVHLLTDSMTLSHGKVAISEGRENETLVATWERQRERGWCIKTIEGALSGLHAQLEARENSDFSERIQLAGRVEIDAMRATKLLTPAWKKTLAKFSIGSGYTLEGDFVCLKEKVSDFTFQGNLYGNRFLLGGMWFDSLYASAFCCPDYVELNHLSIADRAGNLLIEKAFAMKEGGEWKLSVPHAKVESLRPSLLKGSRNKPKRKGFKLLLIPSCELYGFAGTLGHKTSFTGQGDLHFNNIPKRNLFSNLLYIPTEITARIGLDLSLLVPVMGTIKYQIYGGKIYLTQFKDMYSEGKRSRFYLVNDYPAFVDFEGNLNMKVKMKQYNLLMKLAEFFTVTVKGTIFRPSYTFMNQFEDPENTSDDS